MEAIRKDRLVKWGFENAEVRTPCENKAQSWLDRKASARYGKRLLFLGLTAYCIAAGLVGWWMSVGPFNG